MKQLAVPSFTVFREPRHDCAVRAARAPTTVLGSVQGVGGSRTTRIVTARPNEYNCQLGLRWRSQSRIAFREWNVVRSQWTRRYHLAFNSYGTTL